MICLRLVVSQVRRRVVAALARRRGRRALARHARRGGAAACRRRRVRQQGGARRLRRARRRRPGRRERGADEHLQLRRERHRRRGGGAAARGRDAALASAALRRRLKSRRRSKGLESGGRETANVIVGERAATALWALVFWRTRKTTVCGQIARPRGDARSRRPRAVAVFWGGHETTVRSRRPCGRSILSSVFCLREESATRASCGRTFERRLEVARPASSDGVAHVNRDGRSAARLLAPRRRHAARGDSSSLLAHLAPRTRPRLRRLPSFPTFPRAPPNAPPFSPPLLSCRRAVLPASRLPSRQR